MIKFLDRMCGLQCISTLQRHLSNSLFENIYRLLIFIIPILHYFLCIFFSFGSRLQSMGCCMKMILSYFYLHSSYITFVKRYFWAQSDFSYSYLNTVWNLILDKYNWKLSQVPTMPSLSPTVMCYLFWVDLHICWTAIFLKGLSY